MKYIVENWFVIVGLIAVLAAGGYAVYVFVKMPSDKQLNKVREWLLYAVTKAEQIQRRKGRRPDENRVAGYKLV